MTLREFAEKFRLRVKHANDEERIAGRLGLSHISEYGEGLFEVVVMPEDSDSRVWAFARRAFMAAGMRIAQNGDYEGIAVFDPCNKEQVRLAFRYADIRPRREPSAAQIAALSKAREARMLRTSAPEGVSAPRIDVCDPVDIGGASIHPDGKSDACTEQHQPSI